MKPEEFNHIILPLRQELLSRAFGMTGNGEDAEDLVQEAMLRL
ncbi:MAG: sigma factor, partial [Prevotella pectinovora]